MSLRNKAIGEGHGCPGPKFSKILLVPLQFSIIYTTNLEWLPKFLRVHLFNENECLYNIFCMTNSKIVELIIKKSDMDLMSCSFIMFYRTRILVPHYKRLRVPSLAKDKIPFPGYCPPNAKKRKSFFKC